ncbi:AraC family transcriptional regulator [Paenibacillus cellulosilyticus]|uniref:AraC family transcriptional regulator n=1 Tax=Paenibacillus cellulosilyticus TaxID=375489 RepID=A0A2V2Z126_9BACL|nr:AraC family transcriptional regulator [Paenibacillus cellulosilyticus]PWW08785.1 AraC family transcriptional regulator [Paenibacillus cellulosilyticus]QKS48339.1 AraC family transcriptional regulator [Paenibacillus cellulosilyticus]
MDEWFEKQRRELLRIIDKFTPEDGTHDTQVPGLRLIRASRLSEPVYSVYEPSLCIVAQGSKVVMLGHEVYQYDPSSYLTASVHLPITGQVMEASRETPYLSLQILFDMNQILDVIQVLGEAKRSKGEASRGVKVSRMNDTLLDAVLRLVKLVETPQDIPVLAPYVIREIIYRVLQNENNASLKQFAIIGSHAQRIAGVIKKLSRDFAQPLRVDELAAEAHMSTSSLYDYFKEVTGMSPIQFQKHIRLQEARRLLFSESIDAAEAAFQVGYESPSYFNREYARMFGLPPVRDVRRLRSSLVGEMTISEEINEG